MTVSQQEQDRDHIVAALLEQAGIPVPDSEIGKMREMYFGAEEAREIIRSIDKGETEPMIVFAPESEATSG